MGQYNLRDQAYQHATPLAIELTRHGIPVSDVGGGNSVVQYRQNVEYEIRKVSSKYANVFRLGVLIGLAEGQTTSPEPAKGLNLANRDLREASDLMNQNLSFISFDQSLMQKALRITGYPLNSSGDAHTAVQQLRFNYEDAVRRSCG